MLYTGKGDGGTTKLFDCPSGTRISKSAPVFEALGVLDELNCSLGFAKALARKSSSYVFLTTKKITYEEVLTKLQQILFNIQAELGGSPLSVTKEHLNYIEEIIYEIETVLPPIKSFIVPGGGEAGAYLDVCRTTARQAERKLVTLRDNNERKISDESLAFLNRLSSVLYAMARFANYQEGFTEQKPEYK